MSDIEPLSSDYLSDSPPPPPSPRKQQPKASAKAAGLDSSSELSELTEDEQEGASRDSARSSSHASTSATKKKRGSLVPAPMWGWAYNKGRKPVDSDNKPPPPPHQQLDGADVDATADTEDNDEEKIIVDGPSEKNSAVDAATLDDVDEGGEPSERKSPAAAATADDSHDEDGDDGDDDSPLTHHPKAAIREGSAELTDVSLDEMTDDDGLSSSPNEDEDEGESEAESESSNARTGNEPEDAEPPEPPEDVPEVDADDELADNAPTVDADPVVPAAPAGSSIMAGQQLIKTPTPSPSTSPEPEDTRGADVDVPDADPEVDVEPDAEVEVEPEVDIDLADTGEVEAEAEADEAELELQPAHRAEALDVLAGIELRFALLRERLYVEKMEDLAMEEAMVLQEIHPEMNHLQNELQVRHDRRLELAAKKRRHEDEHVSLMRKTDEDAVWSWWKFERDTLQGEMYAEANRKRRKLEREKRLAERPMPVRHVPARPPLRHPTHPLSFRDILECSPLNSRSSRKRNGVFATVPVVYPQLLTLNAQEINSDLQIFNSRRGPAPYNPLDHGIGPGIPPGVTVGIGMGAFGLTPGHEMSTSLDYTQNGTQIPMGLPGGPHVMQSGRTFHHASGAPPLGSLPMSNSAHHPRTVQGPGVHASVGSPFTGPGHRNGRRSPSPPSGAGYGLGHGAMNGTGLYAGPNGPGLGQNGFAAGPGSAGPSSLKQPPSVVNGWGKEHRERKGGKEAGYEDRDRERDREVRRERDRERKMERQMEREREREREPNWHEDDPSTRSHAPHRHGSQIQPQGQTVAHHHHHHVVHAHAPTHHHHHVSPAPRSLHQHSHAHGHTHTHHHQHGLSRRHDLDRHASAQELENGAGASGPSSSRRHGHVHAHNYREGHGNVEDIPRARRPPPGSYANGDEPDGGGFGRERNSERMRDRDREREQHMSHLGGPPPTRPQVTSFVMTPSQAMQGYNSVGGSPTRREAGSWIDEGPIQNANHRRQMLDSRQQRLQSPSRHSPPPPSRRSAPQETSPMGAGPGSYHTHSPSSRHAPRYGGGSNAATPKGSTRPISPVPVKLMPQSHVFGPPPPPPGSSISVGPGPPGDGRGRHGTPSLTGPGARAENGVQPPNGHSMFPAVSALQSANASDSGRGLPSSKLGVVQIGNGS